MELISVGAASKEDARDVARVHVRGWHEAYGAVIAPRLLRALDEERIAVRWAQIIAGGEAVVLTARSRGGIVGFASAGAPRDAANGYDCELHKLYVLRHAQGRGYARELLRTIAVHLHRSGCRAMTVHVLANSPSRNFLERFGAQLLRVAPVAIGGDSYMDATYGWPDLGALIATAAMPSTTRSG